MHEISSHTAYIVALRPHAEKAYGDFFYLDIEDAKRLKNKLSEPDIWHIYEIELKVIKEVANA